MPDNSPRWRQNLLTIFPMFIATLSLLTAIYNGYLNSRFLDAAQGNVGRLEYMRTCKEMLDQYFLLKFKSGQLQQAGPSASAAQVSEAGLAVAHFGALSTYLVNLREEAVREPYTQFTRQLEQIIATAPGAAPDQFKASIGALDQSFATLNSDCVTFSKKAPR